MEQPERTWRHRINVSTTSKGLHSYDCTVEGVGFTLEEALAESDALVAELDARYSNEGETEKVAA